MYEEPVVSLACGQEITEDTTLDRDLTCRSGPALIVAADGITLDLGGHTVFGDRMGGNTGPGIVLRDVHRATVRNGTVQYFGAGVVIAGGGHNVVENVVAQDNIGTTQGDFGDGIVLDGSSDNRIEENTVQRNGPFSGISLLNESQRNEVRGNLVADNSMSHVGDPSAGRQDMGIRMEGPGASDNVVEGNAVTGSGADGIVVLPTCLDPTSDPPCVGASANAGNRIAGNTSNGNGRSGAGDGIRLFSMAAPVAPTRTTIADNVANDNTTNGISIDARATSNTITGNRANGNGRFDGHDNNPQPCDDNTWEGNDFGTANHPCVNAMAMVGKA